MRNPNRIFPLIFKIADLWSASPDLRFYEILLQIEDYIQINGYKSFEDLEDEELEAILKEMVESPVPSSAAKKINADKVDGEEEF